jgi:ABC-type nitrate/sulfonate/bicarbonate transport system permease component
MQFPLSFWDISLWLAVTAIILLITSELISSYHGKGKIPINKQNLRNAALIVGILFIITVIIRVLEIIVLA